MRATRPDQPILWRSRPLLTAAGVVALGILASERLVGVSPAHWTGLIALSSTAALLVYAWPRRRLVTLRPLAITALLVVALAAVGAQQRAVWETRYLALLTDKAAEVDSHAHAFPILIRGTISATPSRTERFLRFRIEVDSVGFEHLVATDGVAEVTVWRERSFGAADSLSAPPVWPDLYVGHHVIVEGLLRPLPRPRNPADFDYGAYLKRRGVHAVVSATGADAVTVVHYHPTRLQHLLTRARSHVRSAIDHHVPGDQPGAVLKALLLADRSGIDPEVRQGFARTGLAHLLAVSGLHVFLVGMVLYGLLKPMLHRFGWPWQRVEWSRTAITLALLGVYVAVVGGPASAVRALVMASAFILGRAFERPSNALNSLGAAALVILLARPPSIMDVGFQLSFAAVGAIVLLVPQLERLIPPGSRTSPLLDYVLRLVLVSVAATLGTMPVLLKHFGLFPVAGIILNVAAIPATALTLAGGLMAVAFHGWLMPLAQFAGAAAGFFASAVLLAGLHGERLLGWTAVEVHVTSILLLAGLSLLVLTIGFSPRPRLRWRTMVGGVGILAAALWTSLLIEPNRPVVDVIFFDVGQGDAALVTLPNGRTLLVDAGPADPFGDAGARTIIPHLDHYRIARVDAVVVSHPHADHLGGVLSLLQQDRVGALYDNGEAYDSELYRDVMRLAATRGVSITSLSAGDKIELDESVAIHILHPGPEPDANTNDASVVLHLTHGDVRMLFAGDVEQAAEATLVHRYGRKLCADVVKVPHHGSRTSSTGQFVAAATACDRVNLAIVPVARRNRFYLPNDEVLEAWRHAGKEVRTTHEEGALRFVSDGSTVRHRPWR